MRDHYYSHIKVFFGKQIKSLAPFSLDSSPYQRFIIETKHELSSYNALQNRINVNVIVITYNFTKYRRDV